MIWNVLCIISGWNGESHSRLKARPSVESFTQQELHEAKHFRHPSFVTS